MADYIIETKDLNVGYGPIHVIYDLDFKAPAGEVTVIVGPNGVGKTSLMKAIMGMITMYSGQIFFEGEDITKVPPHERTMLCSFVEQFRADIPVRRNRYLGTASRLSK